VYLYTYFWPTLYFVMCCGDELWSHIDGGCLFFFFKEICCTENRLCVQGWITKGFLEPIWINIYTVAKWNWRICIYETYLESKYRFALKKSSKVSCKFLLLSDCTFFKLFFHIFDAIIEALIVGGHKFLYTLLIECGIYFPNNLRKYTYISGANNGSEKLWTKKKPPRLPVS